MNGFMSSLQWLSFIPVAVGSIFSCLCVIAFRRFLAGEPAPFDAADARPPATLLKPVCGLEKNLRGNLLSACVQDYPEYQVVFSVQDPGDPALPLLRELIREYPSIATLHIEDRRLGPNRKINNLAGGLARARYDLLVISDSDVCLNPGYLQKILAPLLDDGVGYACTLYKAAEADRWFEKLEALTLNADFIPSVVFAYMTGASPFCLGASVAFRKRDLEAIGGMESLAGYLAEDYELGRRLLGLEKRMVLVPEPVETVVDLKDISQWWRHQVTWDQKTRAARPGGFLSTILTRAVPFAFLFAFLRAGDSLGLSVLGAALSIRLLTAAGMIRWGLGDREGLTAKLALLPFRDMAALFSWAAALLKKQVVWRKAEFELDPGGRLLKGTTK